jgi:hypothetical protein
MGDIALHRDIMRTHQHPLVQKEQKLLERVEERPLGEQADALLADDLPIRRAFPAAQLQQLALRLGQFRLRIVLVEADDAAVHPLKVLHRQHERRRHRRSHRLRRPALNGRPHGQAEQGHILALQCKRRTVRQRIAIEEHRLEADVLGPAHRALEAQIDVAADQAAVEVAVDAEEAVGRLLAAAGHDEGELGDDELVAGGQVGGAAVGEIVGAARRVVDVGGVAHRGELDQLVAGPRRLLALVEDADVHQWGTLAAATKANEGRWCSREREKKKYRIGNMDRHSYEQCCGAGQFLCGSGSSLSKISAPASTIFPIYFRKKIKNFHCFKPISCFIKPKIIIKRFFKVNTGT